MIEFRVLRPVDVWADARRVDAGQPRQQACVTAVVIEDGSNRTNVEELCTELNSPPDQPSIPLPTQR